MKAWRFIAIILVVLLVGWFALHRAVNREPRYQNRPLAQWLEQFGTNHWSGQRDGKLDKEAESAIRQIGTNAIPIFRDMIAARESTLRVKLLTHAPKRWLTWLHLRNMNEYHRELSERRRLGAYGFIALGPEAHSGLPALMALLKDKHPDVRYCAVFALRCLGPVASEALPSLIECLKDPEFTVQDDAVIGLGEIHQDPQRVIPILMEFLKQNRSHIILCKDTIQAISKFGAEAQPAVPRIVECLNDKDSITQVEAIRALHAIDPKRAAFLPILLQKVHAPEVTVRQAAAQFLSEEYPEAAEKAGVYKEFSWLKRDIAKDVSTNSPVTQ